MKNSRLSGIELLRLLAGCMVIILHYNYYGKGLETASGANYYILVLAECICVVAVNLFMLICGYFNYEKDSIKPMKALDLLIQVAVFGGVIYLVKNRPGTSFVAQEFGFSFVPNNYFVILYIVVYVLSPYINLLLKKLQQEGRLKQFVLTMFLLFSVYVVVTDVFQEITGRSFSSLSPVSAQGSQNGYTAINFILCYVIGAWMHMDDMGHRISARTLFCLWGSSLGILFVWSYVLPDTAWDYCNPVLMVEAVSLFLLFSKLKFTSRIINCLASAAFTVYLVHMIFIPKIGVTVAVGKNAFIMIAHMLVCTVLIYLVCWVIDIIYKKIKKILLRAFVVKGKQ